MSAPAQNTRPFAVRTIEFTSAAASSRSNTRNIASRVSRSSALTGGRSRVTKATLGAAIRTSMFFSSIQSPISLLPRSKRPVRQRQHEGRKQNEQRQHRQFDGQQRENGAR